MLASVAGLVPGGRWVATVIIGRVGKSLAPNRLAESRRETGGSPNSEVSSSELRANSEGRNAEGE